ncbi:sugar ABC transporter ATP-binding protein [Ruminococcus sp. 5_1_39BFAA]|uniref:sugar ABC transporter ATP-binding protein n=1 Tax=Ruminococcus sp. 5_1_39BFAA TaxID=457412 RepID=UPI0035667237
MAEDYILELQNISKEFPGVKALDRVSVGIRRGEVHGIVGENGAGKSTLMKILTGVYQKDTGTIRIDGKEVKIENPLQAQKLGLSIIFQEFNLVNSLSIAENIFVGRLPVKGIRGVDWKEVYRLAGEWLEKVGLHEEPSKKVGALSVAGKQMVEIAKALSFHSRIIIMDEPSATLTDKELEHLFRIIEVLKKENITVIYISHRLDEIFRLCDTVTVIRDGSVIDTKPIEEMDRKSIISKMVGRSMEQEYPKRHGKPSDEIILKAEGLTREPKFRDISFELRKGEILGIAGLVGAGRTEIVRCIFGADRLDRGRLTLRGKEIVIRSPGEAIENGIALVTEDRKVQGLVLEESVASNTTLARLDAITANGFVNRKKEGEVARDYIRQLGTKTPGEHTPCVSLSGGNQQKVVLAKWLYTEADILILDEPTRGIDVGAKYEIYQLINRLVDEGKSVIMISSEMPEVISLSDRMIVIHEGNLKGELTGEDMTAENVMKLAILTEEQHER